MANQQQHETGTVVALGSVDGMLAFLDFLVDKGYATRAAVHPLQAAARTVFKAVEGERYGAFDVRTFDADAYMDRFENMVVGKYKQESLAAYRQRLRRAVIAYREYLDNGNVSVIRASARAPRPRRAAAPGTPNVSSAPKLNGNGDPQMDDVATSLMTYPFPLRTGQVATLKLPMRLEKVDAERLAGFLRTLVFEPQLEIPAATP
jgi:hypothetical protein